MPTHTHTHTSNVTKCRAGRCRHLKGEPRALDEQQSATDGARESERDRRREGEGERGDEGQRSEPQCSHKQ